MALESLSETDTQLNSRKYPVQKSGTYSADPVFGDMIRTALKMGFKVVPYDSGDPNCQPKPDNPIFCPNERERGQAQNIYDRILKNDPQAKILVHGGRDHIAEIKATDQNNEDAGFAFMGWHFKNITKIDPFTIDQMHMSERRNPADEAPIYRYTTRKRTLSEPTAFLSTDGKFWGGGTEHDMKIFHPRAKYENGRPTWLKLEGRKMAAVEYKKLNLPIRKQIFTGQNPILVQAFFAGESEDAVPVDQIIILYPNKKIPVLMLPVSKFRTKAKNKTGQTIAAY